MPAGDGDDAGRRRRQERTEDERRCLCALPSHRCQLPRSPCSAMTSARRSAAFCQFVSTACLRAAPISLGDGGGDRLVLLDRRRELVEQHVHVQTRVPLALRFDRAMQRDDARAGDALDVRGVELQVEVEQPRRRRFPFRGERRARDSPRAAGCTSWRRWSVGSEAASLAASPSRWPTTRKTSRPSPRVSGVTISRWSPARPTDATKPFLLQAVQGAAHGRAAQSHPGDDGSLGDARAGRQLSGNDQGAQLGVDARDVVGRCRGGRRRRRVRGGAAAATRGAVWAKARRNCKARRGTEQDGGDDS